MIKRMFKRIARFQNKIIEVSIKIREIDMGKDVLYDKNMPNEKQFGRYS